jgi:hypothetical protein
MVEQSLIIVGHPMTDLKVVEEVLQGIGMVPAKVSLHQGLSPSDVSSHLLKRAGIVPDYSQKIDQLSLAPLWQILALDLFMGNSETGFWGWSDPQSIYLLDYWHTTVPTMHFILVYESLESVLIRATAGQELKSEAIERLSVEWKCFYSELLRFYHRHRTRCLLIHGEQVCADPGQLDDLLESRFNYTLVPRNNTTPIEIILDPLEAALALSLIGEQQAWSCAYAELESQADLPLFRTKTNDAIAPWNSLCHLRNRIRQHQGDLERLFIENGGFKQKLEVLHAEKSKFEIGYNEQKEESELLTIQLHQVQEELERLFIENGGFKQKLEVLHAEKSKFEIGYNEQKEESELLTIQLHQVQEELERIFIENGDFKQKLEVLHAEKSKFEIGFNEQKEESELLTIQLHQVQEELERIFIENNSLKQELAASARMCAEVKTAAEQQKADLERKIVELERDFAKKDS